MATLNCRDCGADMDSETRVTRCKNCGTLFPFICAVCSKSLRPPFPVYADERYLSAANEPLCPDHFERQCPECSNWFRADENPGFFLCPVCSATREKAKVAAGAGLEGALGTAEASDLSPVQSGGAPASGNLMLLVTVSMVVLIVLLVLVFTMR